MTQLTIPNEPAEVEYQVGASSSGPFTIPFSFFQNADVRVSVNDGTTTTDYVLDTDYTVAGTAVDGGFDGGSLSLIAPVSNSTIRIYRSVIIERTTNIPLTGPLDIEALNLELNRIIAAQQELALQDTKVMALPAGAVSTDAWSADSRPISDVADGTALTDAATVYQVQAAGPNRLAQSNSTTGPLTTDVWNNVVNETLIPIRGNELTKLFDLMVQWFTIIENRRGFEAEFYIRFRYTINSYAEVTKDQSAIYRTKIPLTSAMPFNFLEIEKDLDYTNGDGTITVAIDIRPNGPDSGELYVQWSSIAINTSAEIA